MGHVDAVVLDNRVREHARFDVAHSLRRIRPGVPVMIECGDQIDDSPTENESCVSTENLTSAIEHLLTRRLLSDRDDPMTAQLTI